MRARSSRSSRLSPADGSSSSSRTGSARARGRSRPASVRQRAARHRRMAMRRQLDEIETFSTASRCNSSCRRTDGQIEHLRQQIRCDAAMPADQQIFQHGHLREQFAVLERARDAKPRDLVRRSGRYVLAAKPDAALAAIDAADAVEHAGLAGAVRTDQRQQFAGARRQATRRRARPARRTAAEQCSTASSAIPPLRCGAIACTRPIAAALARRRLAEIEFLDVAVGRAALAASPSSTTRPFSST